ncbi:hypothetical protein BGZ89_003547, partial [Linnemannia elongata]
MADTAEKIANATLVHSREQLPVMPHLHLSSDHTTNGFAPGVQDATHLMPPHHPGTAVTPDSTTSSSSSSSSLTPSSNGQSRSSISSQGSAGSFSVGINNGNSSSSAYNGERFSITIGHALKKTLANWHVTSPEELIRVLGILSGTVDS